MKIIPVIDVLGGVVVHAVRGKRKEYQPLKSTLCDSPNPLSVAAAFKACGFKELYVADLDAIMGKGSNFPILEQITEKTDLELMVDAGIADLKRAQDTFRSKVSKIIVGTETLSNLDFVSETIECFGSERVVVSLDLTQGKVLSKSESVRSMSALALACELQGMGVTQMIVLDLARVGSGEGVHLALLKKILKSLKLKLLVGGGIRDTHDLVTLKEMGINGVLLATALHSGKISVQELQRACLM